MSTERERQNTEEAFDAIDNEINQLLNDLNKNLNKGTSPYQTFSPPLPHGHETFNTVSRPRNSYDDVDSGKLPLNGGKAFDRENITGFVDQKSEIYENIPNNSTMYRHRETKEETRSETRSSGGHFSSNVTPRAASGTVTELDSLLQELNTSKNNSVLKDEPTANGNRPNVDSLLEDLNNSLGHRDYSYEKQTTANRSSSSAAQPVRVDRHVSASSATRELDHLMDSLSDFKLPQETTYAKPVPRRRSPSPPPKPTPQPPRKPSPPPTNQLDSMLGSLTSRMTEQGIQTSQKGSCCACQKPIVGQVITALGKPWHPEHFVCHYCKQELGTKNFFEREGKPYCETDYHNLFSPKCAFCEQAILDKCVTAMNKTWHPEHFRCAKCGNTFGDEGFHEKNGKPYCKQDYFNMFAPKCGGCANPIMENFITALNAQWHPDCFVCRDCKNSMAKKSFYEMEGKPVCGDCLGIEDDED